MFKVGDRICCVNAREGLGLGEIYVVQHVNGPFVCVEDLVEYWPERLFVPWRPDEEAQPGFTPLPPNPKQIYGAQKPDLSLIPPVADLHMATAFENGAAKYGAYNWRSLPVEARTYIAAAKRHIDAWLDGQELSSDAKIHNLGHAMACLAILLDARELGNLIDNRPPKGRAAEVQERLKEEKAAR